MYVDLSISERNKSRSFQAAVAMEGAATDKWYWG